MFKVLLKGKGLAAFAVTPFPYMFYNTNQNILITPTW